ILTAVQERSLGYARDDDSAKHYQNSAALPHFMRRPTISHFSFLISHLIKGRAALAANPEP
uniref:hypothetical protein n=1 Tax=Dialister sp. TaxID=1955814 RepID=UPI0040273DE1